MRKLIIIPLFFFSISVFGQFTKNQLYNGINLNIRNKGASQLRLANMLDSIVVSMGSGGGSMVYPGAGIPLSTGIAWGTSIADNSANWNTTYGWGDHASAGYGILSADNTWTGNNAFTNNRVTVSGTTYTLLSSDWGKSIDFTNSSDVTVTLPDGFATGFNCSLYKQGTGDVIVTATTTLESNATPATITVLHAGAYVEHKGSNVWEATGQFGDPASGNMLESVYDPATIAEQLVGLTASQSLTNKSINGVTLNSAGSSSLFLNQAGSYTSPGSSFWSLATGGTLTGVNTITSNAFSQLIFTGTATAGSAGLSFINYGGTVTAFNGTGVNIYSRWNPVFNGNGSGNTNIVAQISHTGSGGTSPNYVDLMVGDFTAVTGYLFQAQTGYFSSNFRFDSNIRDNRDNNIVTQSSSATSSNRTLTIGNTSYSIIDLSNKGVVSFTQAAITSSAPNNAFKITGGAHTALTATSELNDVLWSIDRTVQSATGTVANQRYVYIGNPTHGFVGASTSTREVTVAIKGAPIAGTNATFTRSIGFEVESANVGSGVTNSYAAYFNNQTGATNNNGIGISGSISSTNNYFTINANALATVNSGLLFDFTVDAVFNIKGFTGLSGSTTGNTVRLTGGDGYGSGNTNAGSASITSGVPFGSGTEGSVDIQTRSTGKLGFFNGGGVVKQSVNTILVNNVTSGGTLSTIADYSDLTIYANDAAAIRNNLYRLSEKVLALETALRAYTLIGN